MTVIASTYVNLRALDELNKKWSGIEESLRKDSGKTKKVADRAALILVGAIREEIMSSPSSRMGWSNRTGALARSFRPKTSVTRRAMHIAAVSDLIYARIQDRGGRIYPRTRKALAIPLRRMPVGKWPRHWEKGTLFRLPETSVLFRRKGKKGLEAMYALRSSVKIPPKHYSKKALDKVSEQVAQLIIDELVMGGLKNGA